MRLVQRKLGNAVVEHHLVRPTGLVVAVLALFPLLPFVRIIQTMTL